MKKQRWKADEMEMTINFKSLRISFIFTELCLTIYCLYHLLVYREISEVTIIWSASFALFFLAKNLYTRKMTRTNDNEE